MTSVTDVYDAFLSKVLDDEWVNWTWEEVQEDFSKLLDCAITWFKFPKHDLTIQAGYFLEDLDQQEIQILASYMKVEWLNRCILTWENIKPLYEERDFSQANLLDKLNSTLVYERKTAEKMESTYYRSRTKKSFTYSKLAGG